MPTNQVTLGSAHLCVLTDMVRAAVHVFKMLLKFIWSMGLSSLPLRDLRQENQKFKALWGHTVSSRPTLES